MRNVAEAELVLCSEGSMCAVVTRDGDAPPGSKATSRTYSCRRNLGGPAGGRWGRRDPGGGESRGKTGATCCAMLEVGLARSTAEAAEGNEVVEGRGQRVGSGDTPGRDRTLCRSLLLPAVAGT